MVLLNRRGTCPEKVRKRSLVLDFKFVFPKETNCYLFLCVKLSVLGHLVRVGKEFNALKGR